MTIRPPQSADLPALAAINNQYLGRGSMQLASVTAADFSPYLPINKNRYALWLGEVANTIIGYALVKPYSPRAGYYYAGETSVYLLTTAIGKGYGRALMHQVLASCQDLEYRHLTAKIWTRNQGSIAFHAGLGYTMVGVQHGIGWVAGESVDVSIMERRL